MGDNIIYSYTRQIGKNKQVDVPELSVECVESVSRVCQECDGAFNAERKCIEDSDKEMTLCLLSPLIVLRGNKKT